MNSTELAEKLKISALRLATRLDARRKEDGAPCGKGWEGTKPGCTRSSVQKKAKSLATKTQEPKSKKQESEDPFSLGSLLDDPFGDAPAVEVKPKERVSTKAGNFAVSPLTKKEKQSAKVFSASFIDGETNGAFGKRVFDNAKKTHNLNDDEAAGLAAWLSNGYRPMGELARKGSVGYDVPGGDDGVRGSLKNAAAALKKIPAVTQNQLKERDQPLGQPLSRFIQVDKPGEFIQKYKDSIGKDFVEPSFFGTSAQDGGTQTMQLYSTKANIIYKVNPNLTGNGQGRYVDDLKGWKEDNEGEVLYPPNSRFKVKGVGNSLNRAEAAEYQKLEDAGGWNAAGKAGPAVYRRYKELNKKASQYVIELDEA
jgi:hypothetical protein